MMPKWARILLISSAAFVAALCASPQISGAILSSKRGIADTGANYNLLQGVNAGWYYRWGPGKADIGNFDAEFVPMIWGGFQANQSTIDMIVNYGDIQWVLGFNEPERGDQANMTVAQAISAWQVLSDGFAGTGIKLISPGVADTGGSNGGQEWLSNFMNQANDQGLQVDAVAFHWYGVSNPNDPIGAGNSFLSRVDSYHNSNGLPVWITEFAIHDWGGVYTDEQMREANAIFIDYVIPRLESRSHVAGYSWYNWFGDSTLVEGNPLTPTNVGVPYVGVLSSGEIENITGKNYGEHVAYLDGGELTRTGSAEPAIRYINALGGVSDVSGTVDWGLNESTNWVRVQPGAVLRKTGPNQISLNGISVTNEGVIEAAEGTLLLDSSTSLTGSGQLVAKAGGTIQFTDSGGAGLAAVNLNVEMRGGTITTDEVGGVVFYRGAKLRGEGTVDGNLTVQSGASLRVGAVGISSPARSLIDDFENYPTGQIGATPNSTGDVWTGVFNGTANAEIVSSGRGRALLTHGTNGANGWRGAVTSLRDSFDSDFSLDHGEAGTYFFRVRRTGSATIDAIFGITDQQASTDSPPANDTADPWNEYAVLLSLVGDSGDSVLRAYSDGAGDVNLIPVSSDEWINVWITVNNARKSYRVATSTGAGDGVDSGGVYQFGRRTGAVVGASPLTTFGIHEARDVAVELDDFFFMQGLDLTNPLAGFDPGIVLDAATFVVQGDFSLKSNSSIELDLFDPAHVDMLSVTGNLDVTGILQVALDENAATPQVGDTFDLLDFGSATGAFEVLNLPSLPAGLLWNVTGLLTTGELQVVIDVDLDDDGDVDGADLLLIQRDDPSLIAEWQSQFGSQVVVGTVGSLSSTAVPEPTGWLGLLILVTTAMLTRARSGWHAHLAVI